MVYNPYAKKRARPAEWGSSNSSSSASSMPKTVPVLAAVTQSNVTNSQQSRLGSSASSHTFVNKGHEIRRIDGSSGRFDNGQKSRANLTKNDNGNNTQHAHPISKPYYNPYLKNDRSGVSSTELQRSSGQVLHKSTASMQSKESFHESRVSGRIVDSTTRNTTATTRTSTMLPSSMASIRPTSWKSGSELIDERPKYLVDTPTCSASKGMQPQAGAQLRMQSSGNRTTTSTNTNHNQFVQDDNVVGRLPREISYTPDEVKPIQDEYRMLLIKNAKLSAPLKNGWTLFPHQKKAIVRALTMRRMILALDMGLGKTLIGAVWSKAFKETFGLGKLKVYIICPVSLKEEWRRTAEEKVGLMVQEEKSKAKSKKSTKNKKIVAKDKINEDEELDLKVSICSWAKVPTQVESHIEHFVVCCDEAHAMQSTQAQRTKDVLNLVDDKRYVGKQIKFKDHYDNLQVFCFEHQVILSHSKLMFSSNLFFSCFFRCVGLLLLTGTPMKNGKPSNLFPLLKAVRHPLGRNQKAYEAHFCNGMLKNFGRGATWDASGCSNLDQLKQMVASNLLHMTKEQCLTDLPPMTNIFHDVPVSSRFQIQYEQAIAHLANIQANSSKLSDESVLGAVQRLRVVCAYAKVEATVELARTILDNEPAVVIFTFFAQVAKQVHSKLAASGWPSSLLTGETPQKKRQELVDNFQNGLTSVFVCTFGAGGVGLTLTAASTIVLLDRPWTPGETRQAEDRIRRIGQVKKCKSYWMRSFDLDKEIDATLESKKQTTNAVLNRNGNQSAITGPSCKISINRLIHSFVLSENRKNL
jgi:SNF2 family DNA or RNA helicase